MPNEHTIAENLQRLEDAKTAIANAITAKGGTVGQNDGLEEFPTAINSISTGVDTSSDTVTAATLKSGYTAHNAAGQQITGTMLSQPTTATAETIKEGFTAYNSNGELMTGIMLTSWEQLQQKVRNNDMVDISIGDQYGTSYQGKQLIFDTISKNIDTPANPNLSHTLTLRVHNLLPDNLEFDAPEAFYACQSEALSAGTYYFTYSGTSYTFTLTQSVPVGGQLRFITADYTIESYASCSSTTPIEIVRASSGSSSGTNLGTLANYTRSGNLNSSSSSSYGHNNWKESALRQWLNSDKPAGQWWEPQNPWDRPPAYAETMNGFLYDLDPEFLGVIGKTQVITKYLDTSTGTINGTYTTEDYFFLMSLSQVSSDYSGEGSKYTPYSGNNSRIMYKNGSASNYWLRSPSSFDPGQLYYVRTTGTMTSNYTYSNYSIAVACNII